MKAEAPGHIRPRGPGARALAAVAISSAALLAVPCAASAIAPGLPPVPIPEGAGPGPTDVIGGPHRARPLKGRRPPQNPHMAPDPNSNLHNDTWMSDAYWRPGPLGRSPRVNSTLFAHECASIAFDSRGRIVSVCVGIEAPFLVLLDPVSLRTLASMMLPPRRLDSLDVFTDFSGGGYFYLDDRDRAVVPTNDGRILIVAQTPGPGLKTVAEHSLNPVLGRADKIISALPDWRGRIWFASVGGIVGWVHPRSGVVRSRDLGEAITNSFAIARDGVHLVTDAAAYRLLAREGRVRVAWRHAYRNTGVQKSGQTQAGSGTTPTVLPRGLVAITDNADPVRVVVLRRAARPRAGRVVCRRPVFRRGASSTDQSLIGFGRSLVAENNFGYDGPLSVMNGGVTEPGLTRIDVRRDRRGCRTVWRSLERAPSVVPKISLRTGLVYTYTKPGGPDDSWYLTAIDWRSGRTAFSAHTGDGLGHNNNYAPVTIGPDGSAYVGVLGGLVRIADSR